MTQSPQEVARLLADFNRYFTSANSIDVPARVSVPTAEWRALHEALCNAVLNEPTKVTQSAAAAREFANTVSRANQFTPETKMWVGEFIRQLANEMDGLSARIAELEADNKDGAGTLQNIADNVLHPLAVILKGEPGPLSAHSWDDLPELVKGLKEQSRKAVEDEREACAVLVETQDTYSEYGIQHWFDLLAKEIRSRATTPPTTTHAAEPMQSHDL